MDTSKKFLVKIKYDKEKVGTMVRKKKSKQKDFHDYIYLYGMLVATIIIAIGAIGVVPYQINILSEQIEQNPSLFEWRSIPNYKESLMFLSVTDEGDSNSILTECDQLDVGSEKVLDYHLKCPKGNIIQIKIRKDNDKGCSQRFIGEC